MNINTPHDPQLNGRNHNGSNGEPRGEFPEHDDATQAETPARGEDESDPALWLAATRHLTPSRYSFATPLAEKPQLDGTFIEAEAVAGGAAGEGRVATHHRNLHTMARGGEMHTLDHIRQKVEENLKSIGEGIVRLRHQLSRTRQWDETPSSAVAKPWTWWEIAGAWLNGIGAVACLGVDIHTYWVNLMESGLRTFRENPMAAYFYGGLALGLPIGLKTLLGRFGRKDGGVCGLWRGLTLATIVLCLAGFVAFALAYPSPGSAAGFGTLSGGSARGFAESPEAQKLFAVLLMVVTGALSALLWHNLAVTLDEHRRAGRVMNEQWRVVRDELERLEASRHIEKQALGAIEGKLAEYHAEQEALVDSATNYFRALVAQKTTENELRAKLAEIGAKNAQWLAGATPGAAVLKGRAQGRGAGKLTAWLAAGALAWSVSGCGSKPATHIVTPPEQVREIVFGISPHLPRDQREAIFQAASDWVMAAAPGDRLSVLDALNLKGECEIAIPNESFYVNNPRAREREFAPQIVRLRSFLLDATEDTLPARVMLPQFLSLVAQQRHAQQLSIVVAGSALYSNSADRACYMTDGYFPSDGHFDAEPALSPFSARGRARVLAGAAVHYAHANDDFTAGGTAHRASVERFLALYVQALGGTLASFSPDLGGILRAAREGGTRPVIEAAVNSEDSKRTLHRIVVEPGAETRMVQVITEPLTPKQKAAPAPASSIVDHLIVSVRWTSHDDIDIYGARDARSPELYYGCVRGNDGGVFSKDFHDATTRAINGLEMIEWSEPIDLTAATCWLNYYAGSEPGGVDVMVRVIANEKPYERSYHIPARSGNRGENHAGRASDPHWVCVDLAEICRLRASGE